MDDIWSAAEAGDLAEVTRLLEALPGRLNEMDVEAFGTPMEWAAYGGHVGVVRYLLDQGAGLHVCVLGTCFALRYASGEGHTAVVRLLLERGADLTSGVHDGIDTALIEASSGHLEVVHVLLDHPSAKTIINHRGQGGRTALWVACYYGDGGVARALLKSGADPAITDSWEDTTPMAIAKQGPPPDGDISAQGEVPCLACVLPPPISDRFADEPAEAGVLVVLDMVARCLNTYSACELSEAGLGSLVLGLVGRRRSGPTCCGRPGRWPTSRIAARWRWRGDTRGRSGRRWWTSR
jgi:hypothetical protein